MENNERKPDESIKQWRARIKAQKKEQRIQEEIDKGELLDASIVVAPRFEATISQGTDDKKSRKNNHRVGQKSVFGERKYRQNRSLARRAFNDLTDAVGLTSPPTLRDGYNRIINAEVPLWESAQGQELERMGETAKDAGGLVATGLAFGNPLTASNAMAPLITGSQAYWITHGINDGAQRIENIGEGVQNFVEDPSWQNAGAVAKEVPMLALDVATALPVAKTIVETSKNAIPAAQQAAQRITGSVDDAITAATKQVVESGVVGVNELPAQLAARATSTPTMTSPILDRTVGIQNRVFTGDPIFPKTTWQIPAFNTNSAYRLTGQSQIDDMIQTGFVRPRFGKIKGGHTNEVHWSAGNAKSGYNIKPGQYILESPRGLVDGTSNAIEVNDLSHVWTTRNGKIVDVIDEVRPHMRTVSLPLSSKGAYAFYERPSTYFKDATYAGTPGTYAGKEVPTWQLPKGQRNQPHNPTATERVYSILGRDSGIKTEGIDISNLADIPQNRTLLSMRNFLKQHGVNTENLTLADLENLYGKRLAAIRTTSGYNYNLAIPDSGDAMSRYRKISGYDSEGLVGEMFLTAPRSLKYQPGANIDFVRNATRFDGAGWYDPSTGMWRGAEPVSRSTVSGVSQRMYDAGIPVIQQTNNGYGLMSGGVYKQPQRSLSVMEHYPDKITVDNNGIWHWETLDPSKSKTYDNPVYLLWKPSGKYNHIPTKSSSFFPSAIKDGQITTNVNHGSIFLEDGGKL